MKERVVRQLRSPRFSRKKRKKSSNSNSSYTATASVDTVTFTVSDSAETPLMFEETKAGSKPTSGFEDIARSEVTDMERLERRKSLDQRMLVFQEAVHKRMAQMEQDAKDVKIGNCTQSGQLLLKYIHLIDATLGFVCVVYGSLILAQFDNPAMTAAVTSLTFGSVMLLSSIIGVIGLTTNGCDRRVLLMSAYTAPFIVWFYLFVIKSTLVAQDLYLDYLKENMSVLYLNAARIETLRSLLPLFYIILASLALVEVFRFIAIRTIYDNLVKVDRSLTSISTLWGFSTDDVSSCSSSGSSRLRSGSLGESLAQPLLVNEEIC